MIGRLANTLWMGLGVIGAIWLLTTVATVVEGGDLDPPGAPGSTMQTLDDLVPSWHKKIVDSDDRFRDFGQAEGYILDRETGLVWEQTPSVSTMDWDSAVRHCYERTVTGEVGASKGWRLPTVEELMTLVEPTIVIPAYLPFEHPFLGISGIFWTATTDPSFATEAYVWNTQLLDPSTLHNKAGQSHRAWCVRAPSGFDNVGGS
jgi:hypothetical protein